jgi:hypothetical protein
MKKRRMLASMHPLVLGMFLQGHSIQDIAENIGCTNKAVLDVIDKKYQTVALPTPATGFNPSKISPRLNRGESVVDIAEEFDVWEWQVTPLAQGSKELNPGDPKPETDINFEWFLEYLSWEYAYWVGFFYNAWMPRRMDKIVFVADNTIDFREDLRSALGTDTIEYESLSKEKALYTIRSKRLCRILVEAGMLPARSNAMDIPNIRDEWAQSFARGMIDGSGLSFSAGPILSEVHAPHRVASWLAEHTNGAVHRGRDTYKVTWKRELNV